MIWYTIDSHDCRILFMIILSSCGSSFSSVLQYLDTRESSIQYSSNSIAYTLSVETRRKLVPWICFVGRLTYQAGGMKIVVRGKQASRSEAPILVLAPHSTFIDGGIVYVTGFPSIIVRRESGLNPFIGSRWYIPVSFNLFLYISSYIFYLEFINN